jgi:hypothetical protein
MRYIKKFEMIDDLKNARSGDFVICHEQDNLDTELSNFINNNIGIINHIVYGINFYVTYNNVPDSIEYRFKAEPGNSSTRLMKKSEIVMCSNDRKELEYYLASNKYNL